MKIIPARVEESLKNPEGELCKNAGETPEATIEGIPRGISEEIQIAIPDQIRGGILDGNSIENFYDITGKIIPIVII